jgi:two-component system, OmpR family, sensor histidine kinase VicK
MNYTRPPLAIALEPIRKAFLDAKSRGVRLRYITEITRDNILYCKELTKIVDQLRHLDGIRGNFMVNESECLSPVVLFEEGKIASQIVHSNVKELVEQQQYTFDTFWSKSIPAQQRIREIEEEEREGGRKVLPIRTRLLENQDEIIREIRSLNDSADKLSVCSAFGGMQMSYNYFFDTYKELIDRSRKKGGGQGTGGGGEGRKEFDVLRWIINIDNNNMKLVKMFLESGIQIRHVKNMPPLNFGVSDKEVALTIEKLEGGKMSQSFLISNEPLYVNHFNSLFDELWKSGVDAAERIKDIEQGVDLADIEVIPSSARAQEIYLNAVKSATVEILWIFPTTNAFIRQDKIGAIQLAKQAAKERNVKVRILMPAGKSTTTEPILLNLKKQEQQKYHNNIDVRYIEQMSETKATILVVDRKASLVMELREDSKSSFAEAIGLSTYSNSRAGVLSYVAIFENLWEQTELLQKVIESNEQLKINDRMQKEFINIAAHELRTPIQPILGLTQVLRSKIKEPEHQELLDATIRNAKRLQRLTEDILDVTKIESQSLRLNKEKFNLYEMILNTIADYRNQVNKKEGNNNNYNNLKLELVGSKDEENEHNNDEFMMVVEADKARINQVIMNLLSNAIKFTKEGSITIKTEIKKDNNQVLVSIKDTGIGIDSEILPRLFTKFATKSEKGGTGLGLFIAKSIVEAHGGRIWAENNRGGKGATFYFSIPLNKRAEEYKSQTNDIRTQAFATSEF